MKHHRVARFSAAAVVLALALPAIASAPAGQYNAFNRFDVTITDHYTGLRWQRGYVSAISWDDAHNYCTSLMLGGVGGWRLPSVKELLTLVDEAIEVEYVGGGLAYYAIDRAAFPTTPSGSFWAWPKTPTTRGWFVDFSTGATGTQTAGTSGFFVRCVR